MTQRTRKRHSIAQLTLRIRKLKYGRKKRKKSPFEPTTGKIIDFTLDTSRLLVATSSALALTDLAVKATKK